jgi:hypothetical protein
LFFFLFILKDNHRIYYIINNYGSSTKKADKNGCSATIKQTKESSPLQQQQSQSTDSGSTPSTPQPTLKQTKTEDERLKEALRDVQVAFILKSNDLFESVRKEHENYVPVYINRILYLEQQLQSKAATMSDEEKQKLYSEIIELAKVALEKINQNELLRYFGEKHHEPASDEIKK